MSVLNKIWLAVKNSSILRAIVSIRSGLLSDCRELYGPVDHVDHYFRC